MTILSVSDLTVRFRGGAESTAVDGLSFSVSRGEILAIVGESGSGKSVTAGAVLGLLPANAEVSGSIELDGRQLVGASETEFNAVRGTKVGMIFQNPLSSLDPSYTIASQLVEFIRTHHDIDAAAARRRAAAWLETVGIADTERVLRAYPHQLSGGMRQRVIIAIALAAEPDLIIADEPTTALDATIQKQVLDLLAEINRRLGTTVVIITHDFGVVAHLSDRVLVMLAGDAVEEGSTRELLGSPREPYTRELIAAVPQPADPEGGTRRYLGDPLLAEQRQLRLAAFKDQALSLFSGTPPTGRPGEAGPPEALLEIRDATKVFRVPGKGRLLRKVDFVAVEQANLIVRRGSTHGLIGGSGSGKSTLARLIAQLIPRTSGQIDFGGVDVETLRTRDFGDFRRKIQFVFQDSNSALNPRKTVKELLVEPLLRLNPALTRTQAVRAARQVLDAVGLAERELHKYPHEFSGGQKQRIGIARALIVGPEFLILDEPTSALDVTIQAQVLDLLVDLREVFSLTYLFIGHNLGVIQHLCDTITVMDAGRTVETFAAAELTSPDRADVTRLLLDSVLPVQLHEAA